MLWTEQAISAALGNTFTPVPEIRAWAEKVEYPEPTAVKPVRALPAPSLPPEPMIDVRPSRVTSKRVINVVSLVTKIGPSDILSATRAKGIVRARHIAIHALNALTSKSLSEIGRIMDRDHSTVIHALNCTEANRYYYEPELSKVMARLAGK